MNVYQIGFLIMIIVSIAVSLYVEYKSDFSFLEALSLVLLSELVIAAIVIIFFMLGEA